MSGSESLFLSLAERYLDAENDDPAEWTDEMMLDRIDFLVGEGWHHAGLESQRCERAEAEAERLRNELWLARQDIVNVARDGWDSTRGEKASAALTRIDAALGEVPT